MLYEVITGIEDETKTLVNDIPGVKEATEIKEKVDQFKSIRNNFV